MKWRPARRSGPSVLRFCCRWPLSLESEPDQKNFQCNELDYYCLVNGSIGVSHPRDGASGYLVQADRPMGSSTVLSDGYLGGSDRRVGPARDACAESRAIRQVNMLGAHPRIYRNHLHRRFCAALFQRRTTMAWLRCLQSSATRSDHQLFLRAECEL